MKFFAVVALSVVCAFSTTAFADNDYDDVIEKQVQTDVNFEKNKQEAIQKLQKLGYIVNVAEIDVDVYQTKDGKKLPVLEIEARKSGKKYDIVMEYPTLKIIKSELDHWFLDFCQIQFSRF